MIKPLTLFALLCFAGCVEKIPSGDYKYNLSPVIQEVDTQAGEKFKTQYLASDSDMTRLVEGAELGLKLTRQLGDESLLNYSTLLIEAALKIDPQHIPARLTKAKIIETRHGFAEAISMANSVLATDPFSKQALYILITSHLALGQLPEAAKYADALTDIFPRTGTLALRGLVLITQGREKEGLYDLQRSLAVEDLGEEADSTWARSVMGRYFLERGNIQQAEKLLLEALRIQPGSPFSLDLMGQILAAKGKTTEADEYFERAFVSSKQLAHLRHQAELNQHIGKKQLALDQWKQVEELIRLELKKGRDDHRLDLAKVLVKRNQGLDMKEASELLKKEKVIRQNGETLMLIAMSSLQLGEMSVAQNAILSYLRLGTRNPAAYKLAADIYLGMNNSKKAKMYREMSEEIIGRDNIKAIFL